jgi:MinD superfamily P-loop ATPase
MKQLVVISGKGGTGKTVLSASFAALAANAVLADVDVDASNLHLLLRPEIRESHEFVGGSKARVDVPGCTACGRCRPACRFDAISVDGAGIARVDPLACEGCGLCARVCPSLAIRMEPCVSGEWFVSTTRFGPFVHARLGVAQENSGKLVTEVRKRAREIGGREGRELLIMDGSPGIGCPVIASLAGTDLALIVTEPTPSGAHDMERIAGLARHFEIRAVCAINKFDINPGNSERIASWCAGHGVPVVGKIPFDPEVVGSVSRGVPLVEVSRGAASKMIRRIWETLRECLA